jgi:hypothetical protein
LQPPALPLSLRIWKCTVLYGVECPRERDRLLLLAVVTADCFDQEMRCRP